MKQSTAVLCIKALCYLVVGLGTPLGVSLAQWVNTGEWPPEIVWVVILGACAVSGANNLLAFFSQSYGTWKQENSEPPAATPPKP